MKKRIIALAAVLTVGVPVLAACGSSGDPGQTETAGTAAASDAENTETTGQAGESTSAKGDIHPYAWLGLQDMPKCNYLDIISTDHYIRTYDYSAIGVTIEETEAVDGINTYTGNKNVRSYSIDGKVTSITEITKQYMEYDLEESLTAKAKENKENAIANGTNTTGRSYKGTGKGAVPGLESDTAEYEYYEYDYPGGTEESTELTERYYMKDGDVYAIYEKAVIGGSEYESVKVIKSIFGDIPDGTFDLPDLSGYTQI